MTTKWSRDDEERLRQALHDEASNVLPSADGLARIRERTGRVRFWQRPVVLGLAAGVASVAVASAVAWSLLSPLGDTTVSPAGPVTTSPPPGEPTEAPDETVAEEDVTPEVLVDEPEPPLETEPAKAEPEDDAPNVITVPVYYLAETPAGDRLAREWRAVEPMGSPAETAIALMLDDPKDRDYRTPWDESTKVRSVVIRDDAIKVDLELPAGDRAIVRRDDAFLAIQQIVYTVTAAYANAGEEAPAAVRVLVDGDEIDQLAGQDLSWVLRRASAYEVRQLVQINDPTENATMGRPAVFTGEAAVFEAHLDYVITQNGEVVESDFTTTEEGQTFSRFEFAVDLPPGDYEITISASDPSGGEEGFGPMSDSRRFTVAGD